MKKITRFACSASLILLSACQTGTGKNNRASELRDYRVPANVACPAELGPTLADLKVLTAQPVDENGAIGKPEALDLAKFHGKTVILRVIGTWCPYCKSDIDEVNKRYLTSQHRSQVEVVLVTNQSSKEDEKTVSAFRELALKRWNLDPRSYQLWWVDKMEEPALVKGFQRIAAWKTASGELLFPNYAGVPYAMVYDKSGKLRVRGNFTSSKSKELQDAHYAAIDALLSGCEPPAPAAN